MKYDGLLQAIEALHRETAGRAVAAINRWLVLRNWLIGAYLVEFEQNGEERAAYGEQLLERIAKDVKNREIRGLGVSMLKNCRQFYRFFPHIRQSLPDDLAVPSIGAIRQSLIGESDYSTAKTNSSDNTPLPLAPEQLLRLSWTHLPAHVATQNRMPGPAGKNVSGAGMGREGLQGLSEAEGFQVVGVPGQ